MADKALKPRGKTGAAWSRTASVVAIVFMAFHLYTAEFGIFEAYFQRSLDLTFILLLVFLIYPFSRKASGNRWLLGVDLLCLALVVVIGTYSALNSEEILIRAGEATRLDLWLGGLLLLLVLEATRRAVGWPMVILTLVFFLYSMYGRIFPLAIAHGGFSLEELITLNFMATDGLFGLIIGVLSTYIIIFVIFSSFLEETGAVNFFINLANAIAGHLSGGPAKVAVVSSTLIGALSGSSAANVVTTGSFTIPMMKRMGYRPEMAGGVEAAASTGGQIMPPIMGASAFVIAAILGVSYLDVMKAALIPALLYFFSVGMVVHFICRRLGLKGLQKSDLPRVGQVLKEGWFLFLPVGAIVFFLVNGFTALKAGMWAIIVILIVTAFRRESRITPRKFLHALDRAGRGVVSVGVTGACAGIVVSFIVISGLGLRLNDLIQYLSGGVLIAALFLTMIASLTLGMGMPTVGAYIIVATLGAPALQGAGHLADGLPHVRLLLRHRLQRDPAGRSGGLRRRSHRRERPLEDRMAGLSLCAGGFSRPLLLRVQQRPASGGRARRCHLVGADGRGGRGVPGGLDGRLLCPDGQLGGSPPALPGGVDAAARIRVDGYRGIRRPRRGLFPATRARDAGKGDAPQQVHAVVIGPAAVGTVRARQRGKLIPARLPYGRGVSRR